MARTEEELLERLNARDATLWPEPNVAKRRLGWLDTPLQIDRETKELRRWAETIDQEVIVLLGVGGSALGPKVLASLAKTYGEFSGRQLIVCDTTDPATVVDIPFEESFVIVSSKSGRTLEVDALFAYARTRQRDAKRYAVITDPNTPLAAAGRGHRVNRVFEANPDVGGRYSVLSYFGAVPALLLGYDLEELIGRAMEIDRRASVRAGIAMAEAALEERNKVTIVCGERERAFGSWAEHLLADSTGKAGRGLAPVSTATPEPGSDRYEIAVSIPTVHGVGAAFFDFEIRTVIAAHILGVDPFDEPDVVASRTQTDAVLANLPIPMPGGVGPDALWPYLSDELRPGDYVSVEAYLPYGSEDALESVRRKIRDRNDGVAVTAGYAPAVLHSTGQLHHGGPNSVIAVQLLPRSPRAHLAIPEKPYDFGQLTDALAIGDAYALAAGGRRHIAVTVDDPGELL